MDTINILETVLRKELVKSDIHKILSLSDNYCNFELSLRDFQLIKGMYTCQTEMYNDIIYIIKDTAYRSYLIEIMPYIDDYIDLFFD
jgi:hypothetical protein